MTVLKDYASKYPDIRFERRDAILLMTFGTDGGSLKWSPRAHRDLGYAFADVAADNETKVIIMTGSGPDFLHESQGFGKPYNRPADWDNIYWEGKRLLMNLLEIEVPIIAAVNGPATLHAEIAVLSDVVLASETAVFQDQAHFSGGTVPGDGVHVVWPMLLGMNRGRYFLLTNQALSPREAQTLGIVAEVLPKDKLMPRAWELAEQFVKKPALSLRYTRVTLVQPIKEQMQRYLGYGLALEGMGVVDARAQRPGGS